MNALNRSFDNIETPPLPWATPIPIDCGLRDDAGVKKSAAGTAMCKILLTLSTKAETTVSAVTAMQGWPESANITGGAAAAHEWLGGRSILYRGSILSDTKAPALI